MAGDVFNVCTALWGGGSVAVGTTYALAFKAPSNALGGCVTVVAAGYTSRNVIAVGSAPYVELVTLSTASAVNGTIGTVAAAAFAAGTIKALTITDGFVDADEQVAWKVCGTAANADQIYITGYVQYIMGQ